MDDLSPYSSMPVVGYETKNGRGHDRTQALRAIIGDRSVVYALRLSDGVIKIGCTSNLPHRRLEIEAGSEILGFTFGDFTDEARVHDSLRGDVARGAEYYRRERTAAGESATPCWRWAGACVHRAWLSDTLPIHALP